MKWLEPLLPIAFDKNEIFTIVIVFITVIILKLLPRAMKTSIFIFMYVFNVALTVFGDYLLAGNPYNLYDTLDKNSGELFDFILHLIVYPSSILILISVYICYSKKPLSFIFILCSAAVLILLELISLSFDLFTYINWNIKYSFGVYIIIMAINTVVFRYLTGKYSKAVS
ncbi:hypothetical protein EJF36_19210 [Bacillus sp. HMF5848]|uniref:hypothetical protein n=1 Tax=Bacillus sp. HMF5848 TaxID=2495421 RepID=UPI000F7A47B4|nr:hypothetical protein [Bacillus sp. HMF5848]RSK28833.1 hypothetical protein EJF36_19210 [Bacillus sp. HMF5848]